MSQKDQKKCKKMHFFFFCHGLQAAQSRTEQGRGHMQPPKD